MTLDGTNRTIDERASAALAECGFVIIDRFIGDDLVGQLAAENRRLEAEGRMRPGQVGRGEARRLDRMIRGDLIAWFDPTAPTWVQTRLLERVESLRLEINRRLYLGLFDWEACHAFYQIGSTYRRHRDAFTKQRRRVLSLVTYLNEDWSDVDGGALRLHLAANDRIDIAPCGGRAVLFASDRIEHEVLPARRPRRSIAGWFRRRP